MNCIFTKLFNKTKKLVSCKVPKALPMVFFNGDLLSQITLSAYMTTSSKSEHHNNVPFETEIKELFILVNFWASSKCVCVSTFSSLLLYECVWVLRCMAQ